MITLKKILLYIFNCSLITSIVYAKNTDTNNYALMTASDLESSSLSNISITNLTNMSITASGLFIASFDINDCSSCYGNIVSGDNLAGAVVSNVVFKPKQSVSIGQNYLYNMIYNGIYFIKETIGASPCSLPGCSWPGDEPNVKGWCITINVISRNSNYTYSNYTTGSNLPANTPAYSVAGNSMPFDYKYDLIDPNTLGTGNACLGLITCNDKTLTCSVSTPQNISFQSYS